MTISERQDNEIAKEIQDQLVRQAEQQRQQEEKDAVRPTHTRARAHAPNLTIVVTVIHDLA